MGRVSRGMAAQNRRHLGAAHRIVRPEQARVRIAGHETGVAHVRNIARVPGVCVNIRKAGLVIRHRRVHRLVATLNQLDAAQPTATRGNDVVVARDPALEGNHADVTEVVDYLALSVLVFADVDAHVTVNLPVVGPVVRRRGNDHARLDVADVGDGAPVGVHIAGIAPEEADTSLVVHLGDPARAVTLARRRHRDARLEDRGEQAAGIGLGDGARRDDLAQPGARGLGLLGELVFLVFVLICARALRLAFAFGLVLRAVAVLPLGLRRLALCLIGGLVSLCLLVGLGLRSRGKLAVVLLSQCLYLGVGVVERLGSFVLTALHLD